MPEIRYVPLPDAHSIFLPDGGPLFYFIFTSEWAEKGYANPMLTDAFPAENPAAIWQALDKQFTWSQGNFYLLQRLFVEVPGARYTWPGTPPVGWENFAAAIPLYVTGSPERPADKYMLFEISGDRKSLQPGIAGAVREFPDLRSMKAATKPGGTYIGTRLLEYFFWHIHM